MKTRCLLLVIAVLTLPNVVGACANNETVKTLTQQQDIRERLSKSEYIVEKGELVRRPDAVTGPSSTALSRDDEFRVMKKAVEAAKAKSRIDEGVGIIIGEGKDYYEVTIGSAPGAERGADYAAKIMVDKKSLEVAWVEMNDPKQLDEEARKKVAQFRDLSERLTKSEYVVEKGELTRRSNAAPRTSTSLNHESEFQVMKKGVAAAREKLIIPDGVGVIIQEQKEHYEVIIGDPPPPGVRGPDYTAKVLVDKKNLNVTQILAGG